MFSFAVSAADYDNDGYTDLLVSSYGQAILYRNKGDGTFEDVSAKAGISVPGWAISSAWLDYDRDGCVDLFVGRYVSSIPNTRAYYAADNYPGPLDYEGDSNLLFRNNCNGTFTDVSVKSGLAEFKGRAMGVTAADYDADGYPDIYVANDKTENYLFRNKRNGTFEEIALPREWPTGKTAKTRPPWDRCFSISIAMAATTSGSVTRNTTGFCKTRERRASWM